MLVFLGVVGVVVVLVVLARSRQARSNQGSQYDASAGQRASVSLGPLQGRDPALTEQSIVDHVRPMADQLRNAWCAGDMLPARPFVSESQRGGTADAGQGTGDQDYRGVHGMIPCGVGWTLIDAPPAVAAIV